MTREPKDGPPEGPHDRIRLFPSTFWSILEAMVRNFRAKSGNPGDSGRVGPAWHYHQADGRVSAFNREAVLRLVNEQVRA